MPVDPDVEVILEDIDRRLNETAVIVSGIRLDTDTARDTAQSAVQDIASTRVDVRGYTDYRIQEVLDYFIATFDIIYANVIINANGYADTAAQNAVNQYDSDQSSWRNNLDQTIADIYTSYNILNSWAENTYNVEIPNLWDELIQLVDSVADTDDNLLNEVNTARRETAEMAARWREIADNVEHNKNRILEWDYSLYELKDEINQRLSLELDGRFAVFDQKITAAVGPIGAVVSRVDTLEVSVADQQAQVQNLEIAMIDADEQLAQQIQSISVGTNTQFDSARIWHFEEAVEGWSGTGVIWSDGWLRVPNAAQSPTLSISASSYRQIRFRVRKVGSPVWNGSLEWQGATPSGPESIAEPSWDANDTGEVTVSLNWTGTLTRLTISLGSGNTGPDYYEIDWLAVGRPSPGASSAELNAERTARITADTATATRIDSLETELTNTQGSVSANSTAISGLGSTITNLGDSLDSTNSLITILNNRVDTLENDGVNSTIISNLTNRVEATENSITAINSRVDQFDIDLGDKVSSNLFNSLTQRVTDNEASIGIVNSNITSMNSSIATMDGNVTLARTAAQDAMDLAGTKGKVLIQDTAPNPLDRLVQNLWIDTTNNNNTPKRWNGSAWAPVTDKAASDALSAATQALAGLTTKADASALNTVETRITQTENSLSSIGIQVNSMSNTITQVDNRSQAAQSAAQNALTTASGMGKVFFQPTAPATAERLPQNLWIDTLNNNNTPKRWNGSAWVAVTDKAAADALAAANAAQTAVGTKAEASAVTALDQRVTNVNNALTTVTSRTNAIENRINNPTSGIDALASSISNVTSQVTQVNNQVAAQTSAINSLTASVNGATASGLFNVQAVASPAGALSRVAISAKATSSEGNSREAAMYLEAHTNNRSKVIFNSDSFSVLNNVTMDGLIWENGALKIIDEQGNLRMIMGKLD